MCVRIHRYQQNPIFAPVSCAVGSGAFADGDYIRYSADNRSDCLVRTVGTVGSHNALRCFDCHESTRKLTIGS